MPTGTVGKSPGPSGRIRRVGTDKPARTDELRLGRKVSGVPARSRAADHEPAAGVASIRTQPPALCLVARLQASDSPTTGRFVVGGRDCPRKAGRMENTPRKQRPAVIVNPGDDGGFGELVNKLLGNGARTIAALQSALRQEYPLAVVHSREISDERVVVWYVYRDGRWVRPGGGVRG